MANGDNSAGSTAIGVGLVGFGVLLIYAAYTGQKLFGADGIIPKVLTTGKLPEGVGAAAGGVVGKGAKKLADVLPKQKPAVAGEGAKPPGSGEVWT